MENSDLIMRALKSHALALEMEITALRSDVEHAGNRADILAAGYTRIAAVLWPDADPVHWEDQDTDTIIAELQRRGVMNGGLK